MSTSGRWAAPGGLAGLWRRLRLPLALAVVVALAVTASVVAGVRATASPERPAAAATAASPAPATAAAAAKAAAAQLLSPADYDAKTGLIGKYWWESAVALSSVETYAQATGDHSYDSAVAAAFAKNSAGHFENGSDDDTTWWGLVWLQAYDMTGNRAYLSAAQTIAGYVHQDWDSTCGGGVWWQRDPQSYKNAISNELFLQLTAWLHNDIPGDTRYLGWAQAEWSWFDHSGMINSDGLVNDGLDAGCHNNGQTTWTYNQGVILAGLAQLYRATGDRSLLTTAERIGQAAVSRLTVGGVLTEPCTGPDCAARLGHVAQPFKGIFVRDLKVLAVTAGTRQFNQFFADQASAVGQHGTSAAGQIGMLWSGPPSEVSAATQAAGLDALVAALPAGQQG